MENEAITSKPRTLKELASFYSVAPKTFKSWLNCPTLQHVHPESGNYYSIKQVQEIVNHLGEP